MATSQRNQPGRGDGSDERSFGNPESESASQREYDNNRTQSENSQEQDAFNKNKQGMRTDEFGRDDVEEERSTDRKIPKMSMDKDDDDTDTGEDDDELLNDIDDENTDDEEDDGLDSIPGKD